MHFLEYTPVLVGADWAEDQLFERLQQGAGAGGQFGKFVLIVPSSAALAQNFLAVKSLVERARKENYTLAVVLKSAKGRELFARLGVPAAASADELSGTSPTAWQASTGAASEGAPPAPLAAPNPSDARQKIRRRRELLERLSRPKKSVLAIMGAVMALMLFLLVSVALPEGSVTLTPARKTLEVATNITLLRATADANQLATAGASARRNVLAGQPMSVEVTHQAVFSEISEEFLGNRARGVAVVQNASANAISLRPKTRLAMEGGILFELDDWAHVPARGEVSAAITAALLDARGEVIGTAGNVEVGSDWVPFSIPDLSPQLRALVSAQLRQSTSGGTNERRIVISQNSIDLAVQTMEDSLKKRLQEEAQRIVELKNTREGLELATLTGPDVLFISQQRITTAAGEAPQALLGSPQSSFQLRGSMQASFLAYNSADIRDILVRALQSLAPPNMVLSSVRKSLLTPEILEVTPEFIKFSVLARGVVQFSPERAGTAFLSLVQRSVAGKTLPDAKKILLNMEQVSHAELNTWPPFLGNMPRFSGNITVRFVDAGEL